MHHLRSALVYGTVGAAVTVAVAWSCVLFQPIGPVWNGPTPDDLWSSPRWLIEPPADWSKPSEFTGWRWTGFDQTYAAEFGPDHRDPSTHAMVVLHSQDVRRAGLPFRCLLAARSAGESSPANPGQDLPVIAWTSGIQLSELTSVPPRWLVGTLPVRPIPSGFAADAVLYGLVAFVLVRGPRSVLRARRRRHGLCARCGYPLGNSPVCSECGASAS